jgi:uncharacterized protein (DUF302 family)
VHDVNGRLKKIEDMLTSRGYKVMTAVDMAFLGTIGVYAMFATRR